MDDAATNAQRGELPIACTLDSKDGLSRMQRWQRLHELAIPVASLMDGELTVRYQRGPGVLDELRDLVEDERLCCAFVSWAVTEDEGQPVLRVTAPEGSPRDIEPIAIMFAASN